MISSKLFILCYIHLFYVLSERMVVMSMYVMAIVCMGLNYLKKRKKNLNNQYQLYLNWSKNHLSTAFMRILVVRIFLPYESKRIHQEIPMSFSSVYDISPSHMP
jgi:hypothetical protein